MASSAPTTVVSTNNGYRKRATSLEKLAAQLPNGSRFRSQSFNQTNKSCRDWKYNQPSDADYDNNWRRRPRCKSEPFRPVSPDTIKLVPSWQQSHSQDSRRSTLTPSVGDTTTASSIFINSTTEGMTFAEPGDHVMARFQSNSYKEKRAILVDIIEHPRRGTLCQLQFFKYRSNELWPDVQTVPKVQIIRKC